MLPPSSLLAELKRRRVFRALIGYGLAAFAVLQIIEPVMHGLHWPESVLSYVVVALAAGFPVVVGVAWIFDAGPAGITRTAEATPGGPRGARLVLLFLAVGLLAAAPGAILFYAVRGHRLSRNTPGRASIAVLPLANISPQASDEYFADGMTEQLISTLSQLPGLRVIARTSVARFKGAPVDAAEIGRQLQVGWLLEGSVRKDGERLRISVQLIEVEGQEHAWSEEYDRQVKEVFAIQSDVARRVAQALRVRLVPAPSSPPTESPQALDAYLRGLYFSAASQRGRDEEHALDLAISMFQRATELDPRYARAYASLGRAWAYKFFTFDPDPRWEQAAFVATERALALDEGLAEVHLARADLVWTLQNHFPHERAVRELRGALRVNPNLADGHGSLGAVYLHLGFFDQALSELGAAILIDPANEYAPPRIARIHLYQGRYEQALREYGEAPGWEGEAALALGHLGRAPEALALLDGALARAAPASRVLLADLAASRAVILAGLGRRAEALESIERAKVGKGTSHFHHAEYSIASAHALLGDAAPAVEALEATAADGLPCYPLFERDPNLAKVRTDARFAAFLQAQKRQWDAHQQALAADGN